MRKSISCILLTSLLLFGCQPERANQYMAKSQFAGPPPDNKVMWDQIVDGKITTTPVMAELWTPIVNASGKETKMKENQLYMLFGSSLGKLYNFDYRRATFKWTNKYDSPVVSSPSVNGNSAYVGLKNGEFIAVDVITGNQIWKIFLEGELSSDSISDEKYIYIGTKKGIFYCIDRETGKINWQVAINGEINANALLYKDMIYFGASDGNLYALTKDKGSIKWTFKTNGKIQTMPVAADGNVYIISDKKNLTSRKPKNIDTGDLSALNAETGSFIWGYSLPEATKSSPSINVNKDMIYVVSGKTLLYISLSAGKKMRETPLPSYVETPVINLDGFIYITDVFGKVYNIDETNQQIKWQFEGAGRKTTAPFLFNGIVHYGTDEGVVYAVGRNEDVHIYASLISKTDEVLRNRTGYTQFRMLDNIPSGIIPTGALRRIYNLSDPVNSSIAYENDALYLGAGNKLYSLRTDSDLIRWTTDAGAPVNSAPTVYNRQVYYSSEDTIVTGLNAENKDQILWKYKTKAPVHSTPFIADGNTYFGSDDKKIYALNNQGNLKWTYATGGKVKAMPVVFNNILYCGSNDSYFYAINVITGELMWKVKVDAPINGNVSIAAEKLYFGDDSGKLYCLNIDKGQKVWEFKSNGAINSSPSVIDERVIFGSKDKNVYALEKEKGAKLWSFETKGEIVSSPSVVDGYIYIGSADHNLYSLKLEDGLKKWSFPTEGPINTTAIVVAGAVYVGSGSKVYAIQ